MATIAHPTQPTETVARLLADATVAHRDAQAVAERCAKTWRERVVECLDAGMTQRDVAELAGVSRARLHAILVREHSRA